MGKYLLCFLTSEGDNHTFTLIYVVLNDCCCLCVYNHYIFHHFLFISIIIRNNNKLKLKYAESPTNHPTQPVIENKPIRTNMQYILFAIDNLMGFF